MDPMKLYFDVRDIFRAPRLGLSGKKIWVFVKANLIGYFAYWVLSYLAFLLGGMGISETWNNYGLYPCLYRVEALPWYSYLVYWLGSLVWVAMIFFACTAVARITYKQLKGNEFFTGGDAWNYVKKHWHPVVLGMVSILLIAVFFIVFAGIFALIGKIPYVGEFLFAIPYLLYFLGSLFAVYTFVVFVTAFIYGPAIVATLEEDTMGTVFQSYSTTWSQPWRIVAYHLILLPLVAISVRIFSIFFLAAYKLINIVFGMDWLMGEKLHKVVGWATDTLTPNFAFCEVSKHSGSGLYDSCLCSPLLSQPIGTTLSGTEYFAGVIVAIFMFILILVVFSYGLSILSVGETLIFTIFKKKTDDDNLLEHKDEDDEEEDDTSEFNDDESSKIDDEDQGEDTD